MKQKRVAYVYPYAFQYRLEFHDRLRKLLGDQGISYDVIYSSNPHFASPRGDLIAPPWAIDVKCSFASVLGMELRYQHAFNLLRTYDLVIVQQENGLLINYPLQILRKALGIKVAFFGHGRNFQSANANGWRERLKQFWITKVDWWFAYTQRSADLVAQSGFATDRITSFNNAIDTRALQRELSAITLKEIEDQRRALGIKSDNVGVYIGALYEQKRIDFLIRSAELVRAEIDDFQLIIMGGGEHTDIAKAAAERHEWIHYLGPKFGREKTLTSALSRVFLMPGLVGLGVLDSFAYGTPMVTTELPYHSPEIDYLKDGVNGVIVQDSRSEEAYAGAVVRVLRDEAYRERLKSGAAEALHTYTVEAMADRFAHGVMRALELGR